jgi:hypothetical protein
LLNTTFIDLGERIVGHLSYLTSIEKELERAGDTEVDNRTQKRICAAAQALGDVSGELKLKVSEWSAWALMEAAVTFPVKASVLCPFVHDAALTVMRELHSVKFLPSTPDMERYLDRPFPFGKHVSESFPDCSEDICESYECFAFGRYTAAMFHLGRAMEIAVKRLAKRMRVAKPARDEWQPYINAMNEKIKTMPFKTSANKARRAIFSEATNYLFNFKEAWRNPTMHPKKTYTRGQALNAMEGAGFFFAHVSKTLFKPSKSP